MNCRVCGKPLKAGNNFCIYCGAKIKQAGTGQYSQGAHGPTPGQPRGSAPGQPYGPPPGRTYGPPPTYAYGAANMAGSAVRGGARAARSALSVKYLALIAVALIAIAGILYTAFLKSGTPEDTVQKLEKAMNDVDQNQMLECFDEQTRDLYEGSLSVLGMLTNKNVAGLEQFLTGLGGIFSSMGKAPEFDLEIKDIEYTSDETCLVTVDFLMDFQGETSSGEQVLPMKKVGREWLITTAVKGVF